MICNLRMKMKKLEMEHPNINDIPGVTVMRLLIFQAWNTHRKTITKILSCLIYTPDPWLKHWQEQTMVTLKWFRSWTKWKRNYYLCTNIMCTTVRITDLEEYGNPWHPSSTKNIRFGDVVSCDGQLKYKNSLGWIYWSMAGTNGEKNLRTFATPWLWLNATTFKSRPFGRLTRQQAARWPPLKLLLWMKKQIRRKFAVRDPCA